LMPIPPLRSAVSVWQGGGRSDPIAVHVPANEMIEQRAAQLGVRLRDRIGPAVMVMPP